MIAILPGAETGVDLADKLAARLGTRNNGEELTEARRNKFLMGEQASRLDRSVGVVLVFLPALLNTSPAMFLPFR